MNDFHIARPLSLINVGLYIIVIIMLMSYTIYDAFFANH